MSQPAAALLDDDARTQRTQALIDRQIDILGHLAEAGLKIALTLSDEVKAGNAANEATAHAFDRVSRAVRLSLMLQEKLLHDQPLSPPNKPEAERLARVERIVVRAVDRASPGNTLLEKRARERLDRDFFGDLLHRPISEVIAHICRDLGFEPNWDRLSDEAWAEEEIFSGEIGEPFKGLTLVEPYYLRKHAPPAASPPELALPP